MVRCLPSVIFNEEAMNRVDRQKTIQSLTMGLSRWYLLAMKEKVV